ncbi:MAG: hypothetical protein ACFFC7_02475 [Candidatus Hermodarchaeota archaeon]
MTKTNSLEHPQIINEFPICIKNIDTLDSFKPARLTVVTLLRQEKIKNSQEQQGCILSFLTSSSSEIRNIELSKLLMPLCIRIQLLLDGNKNVDILGPIEVQHQKAPPQDMIIYLYRQINDSLVFCLQYERQYSPRISSYILDSLFRQVIRFYISENLDKLSKSAISLCRGVKRGVDKFLCLQEQRSQIGSSCFNLGTVSQLLPDYEQTVLACLDLLTKRKPIIKKNIIQALKARGVNIEKNTLEEILLNLSLMGYLQKVTKKDAEVVPKEPVFQLK